MIDVGHGPDGEDGVGTAVIEQTGSVRAPHRRTAPRKTNLSARAASEQADATPKKPKTKVHNDKALRTALGLSDRAWAKARWAGLVPDADRAAGTWSGHIVEELVARADEIRRSIPDVLDADELQSALGADWGQWHRAWEAGLIPARDATPYWTRARVAELLEAPEVWRRTIPSQPLGDRRSAKLLAELTGLAVHSDDLPALAAGGHVYVVGEYEGHDLYDVDRLRLMPADSAAMAALTVLVRQREAWIEASLLDDGAAARLQLSVKEFRQIVAERAPATGWGGRYAIPTIDELGADQDLIDRIYRARTLGPDQAAAHLEIRRIDLNYLEAAGVIAPVDHASKKVGTVKEVPVPLYLLGDLEDARAVEWIDWEELREVKAGQPSPLREWARLPVERATVVRAWCRELHATYNVEVWHHWANAKDTWEIDWELNEEGHPTLAEVEVSLAGHAAARYSTGIRLSTEVGEVIRWAREMLRPGRAAVLETNTTSLHGVVLEVAALDPATGEVLVDTLVHPAGVPTEAAALEVHGITETMLTTAPHWSEVVPDLLAALDGRVICSYNAEFDERAIKSTQRHANLAPDELPADWRCLMTARSTWLRVGRWLPLGAGAARALPRAESAREILLAFATAPVNPMNRRRHDRVS